MEPFERRTLLKLVGVAAAGAALPEIVAPAAASAATPSALNPADASTLSLGNARVKIDFANDGSGWAVADAQVINGSSWLALPNPTGAYGLLYSDSTAAPSSDSVSAGAAGTFLAFTPDTAVATATGLRFTASTARGSLVADWSMDPANTADVLVTLTFMPNTTAWYSLATPTLVHLDASDIAIGSVPGYWTSTVTQSDHELGHDYGEGIPTFQAIARERTAPIPLSVLHTTSGASVAVIAAPGTTRDPWPSSAINQTAWQLGLASTDHASQYSPTLYHPVLGQAGSRVTAGTPVTFAFRYTLVASDWYNIIRHADSGLYPISSYLSLARNQRSLMTRLAAMQEFVAGPSSQWHTWTYGGLMLGAESDKLSDVGAMWMLARVTGDPVIENERLPYARNFKLAQQSTDGGAFDGAALGEYFTNGQWISENFRSGQSANYVSPIFTTFYTLADMGNILLFDPDDSDLKDRVRRAADKLLAWQHADGGFDVGYLRSDASTLMYPELVDYRATWYGLLVAYKALGDAKYLAAARRGADWFMSHAVNPGRFLGVCDDTRLACDFHVAFAAQALMDLASVTGIRAYANAAVKVGEHYTEHIYHHPIASSDPRTFEGKTVAQWQISQVGLPFEHGGFTGSANTHGPILLTAHAGAFIRLYEQTKDPIYRDLARAATRGRDAFVGATSSIPSYYWNAGSGGSTVYPWHGWWHAGWMVDYLMAEAHLRSSGSVSFPRGYMTAKVGASAPYGFANGTVYGQPATLTLPPGLVDTGSPEVDWLAARSPDGTRLFVMLLNTGPTTVTVTAALNARVLSPGQVATWHEVSSLHGGVTSPSGGQFACALDAYGFAAFAVDLTLAPDPAGPVTRTFAVSSAVTAPVVTWSYWVSLESWVQWRVQGAPTWTDTASSTSYTFSTMLDLSSVATPATVEIRLATRDSDGNVGYGPIVTHQIYGSGPDLARTGTATASSIYTSAYTPDKAIDGNTTDMASRWLSATTDVQPWLAVKLAAQAAVKLVRVVSGPQAQQRLVDFTVQSGDGAGGWTTIGAVTGNTAQSVDVPVSATTQDIRLLITTPSRDPINVARVFELSIYDTLT